MAEISEKLFDLSVIFIPMFMLISIFILLEKFKK